jgi:hypothetical protein
VINKTTYNATVIQPPSGKVYKYSSHTHTLGKVTDTDELTASFNFYGGENDTK